MQTTLTAPLNGASCLQSNITLLEVAQSMNKHLQGTQTHLFALNSAPDITSLHDMNKYLSGQPLPLTIFITACILVK